jgi:hypothetical protein
MRNLHALALASILAACGSEPLDGDDGVELDEVEASRGDTLKLIGRGSAEWWNNPWCASPISPNWGDNGFLHPAAELKRTGLFSPVWNQQNTLDNVGKYNCVVDLDWSYWPKGVSAADNFPTAQVQRSYLIFTADGTETIGSGKVGHCVPGDGGTLLVSVVNPEFRIYSPPNNAVVGTYYECK